jgi:uncharacterized glyoxalase superfamily protein PhnB
MSMYPKHSTATKNRSMPPGAVIPELAYADVREAATWLCKTFGFKERLLIGNHRIQLLVGAGSVVVIELPSGQGAQEEGQSESGAPQQGAITHSVMVPVEDVDSHHERVAQAGARILRPPSTYPFGERQYTAEDLGGHRWTFSQSVADVDPKEWGGVLVERDQEEG